MRWKFARIVEKIEEIELALQKQLKNVVKVEGFGRFFLILFIPQIGSPKKS